MTGKVQGTHSSYGSKTEEVKVIVQDNCELSTMNIVNASTDASYDIQSGINLVIAKDVFGLS